MSPALAVTKCSGAKLGTGGYSMASPDVDGVADPQGLRVDEADDVAGLGALDGGGVATEDRLRELRREGPAAAGVGDDHAALERPRHDPGVGEPVAVGVVHPRLHLEDERAEVVGDLAHRAVDALGRAGVGGDVEQQVEQLRDAEVLQGRGEHHRRGLAGQEALLVVVGLVEGEQLVLLERRRSTGRSRRPRPRRRPSVARGRGSRHRRCGCTSRTRPYDGPARRGSRRPRRPARSGEWAGA